MTKPILTVAFLVSGAALVALATHRPVAPPPVGDVVLGPVSVAPGSNVVVLPDVLVTASPRRVVALPTRARVSTRREWTRPLEPCWTPTGNVRVWDTQEPARP